MANIQQQQIQQSIKENKVNDTFIYACETGNLALVAAFLSANPASLNPGHEDNQALKLASQNSHLEILKLLVAESRVDINAENGFALKFASQQGLEKVVEILLSSGSCSPASKLSGARLARKGGFEGIAVLLDPQGTTIVDASKVNADATAARNASKTMGWAKGTDVFSKFS